MATDNLKNSISSLKKQYAEDRRFDVFGVTLNEMHISGFRGITDEIKVTLDFPITAISGLNGAGKSTISQLGICAFSKLKEELASSRYYVKDFFPISKLDNPISSEAKIKYVYQVSQNNKRQDVTVTRSVKGQKWSGYKRQPQKHCLYVGFLVYLPKVEKKDFTITTRHQKHTISSSQRVDDAITLKMANIVGYRYDMVSFEEIQNEEQRSTKLAKVEKLGKSYSENNMGFGEGRILYIVNLLETSPDKSFFAIEEPEIALHEEAQFRFTEYLIDVCRRKKHQIILSTHSRIITNTLPPEARKLIQRENGVCRLVDNVSSSQISSALSQKSELIICVEDIFAKELLTEVIRKIDKEILPMVSIHEFGDKKAVKNAVTTFTKINQKVIGVRDADVGSDKAEKLLSFPIIMEDSKGEKGVPPEKDVFNNKNVVDMFNKDFSIDISWIFQQNKSDHHDFPLHISQKIKKTPEAVRAYAIDSYLSDSNILKKHMDLINDIKEILQKETK